LKFKLLPRFKNARPADGTKSNSRPGKSKPKRGSDFQSDLVVWFRKLAVFLVPEIVEYQENVIAGTPGPAQPAIQSKLP
jgi:hypothetical protein